MKELHIIMKNPAGNDPLDLGDEQPSYLIAWASVGFKFLHEDGKWYGQVVLTDKKSDAKTFKACIEMIMNLAFDTEEALLERDEDRYDFRDTSRDMAEEIHHVESTPEIMGYNK